MTYQEAIVELIQGAAADLFRSARTMPQDKLEWKPAETSRSPLELVQEIVQTTGWTTIILNNRGLPDLGEDPESDARDERKAWATLDACETELNNRTPALFEAIQNFPVDQLKETVDLPWGTMSWLQVIDYAYWNIRYHDGQIQYVQTMYGDTEMH